MRKVASYNNNLLTKNIWELFASKIKIQPTVSHDLIKIEDIITVPTILMATTPTPTTTTPITTITIITIITTKDGTQSHLPLTITTTITITIIMGTTAEEEAILSIGITHTDKQIFVLIYNSLTVIIICLK